MAEIKVEILTERRIIPVQQGWLRGSQERIEVDVCVKCAAVVFDPIGHDDWHRVGLPRAIAAEAEEA